MDRQTYMYTIMSNLLLVSLQLGAFLCLWKKLTLPDRLCMQIGMQIEFSGLVNVSLKPEVTCDISNSENDTTHKPSVTIQKKPQGCLVWQIYIYV